MKELLQRCYPDSSLRAADGFESETNSIIEGYAAVWDAEFRMSEDYIETVKKGAFAKTLTEQPDIRLTINHDANLIVARTSNGSLEVWEDEKGLAFKADLSKNVGGETTYVTDLKRNLKSGLLKQCSFMFDVIRRNRQELDDGSVRIELIECSLAEGDVSIVTYPAYVETSVMLRSLQRSGIDIEDLQLLAKSNPTDEDQEHVRGLIDRLEKRFATKPERTKEPKTETMTKREVAKVYDLSDDDLRLMGEFAASV